MYRTLNRRKGQSFREDNASEEQDNVMGGCCSTMGTLLASTPQHCGCAVKPPLGPFAIIDGDMGENARRCFFHIQ